MSDSDTRKIGNINHAILVVWLLLTSSLSSNMVTDASRITMIPKPIIFFMLGMYCPAIGMMRLLNIGISMIMKMKDRRVSTFRRISATSLDTSAWLAVEFVRLVKLAQLAL